MESLQSTEFLLRSYLQSVCTCRYMPLWKLTSVDNLVFNCAAGIIRHMCWLWAFSLICVFNSLKDGIENRIKKKIKTIYIIFSPWFWDFSTLFECTWHYRIQNVESRKGQKKKSGKFLAFTKYLKVSAGEKSCWWVSLLMLCCSTKDVLSVHCIIFLYMFVPEASFLFISSLIELSTLIKFPKDMWKLTCSQHHCYRFSILLYCLSAQLWVLFLCGTSCKSSLSPPNL